MLEGRPLILVEDGKVLDERLRKSRVNRDDILMAARETQGLAAMEEIRYAVLEPHGGISIIPRDRGACAAPPPPQL